MKLLLRTVSVVLFLLCGSVYANKEIVGEGSGGSSVSEGSSASGSRFAHKPMFTRCTKDLNRWGHSSRCSCALESQEYNSQIGKCVTVKGEQTSEIEEAAGVIVGCEGGSKSADGLVISCPDGSVYHRSRSTAEDLSRSLAEVVEERAVDTEVEEDRSYSEPFAGAR
ncbi:MAG: hypothetical protein K9K67_11545 [Bacteriovoracaceae bacterium]|nr:hypothetical protein [Bacteriovoracaceae bacterium]